MDNKQLSINSYSQNGAKVLHEISENEAAYVDFLKFHGRVFKHNANVALEFYAQNPKTEFIATREQWARVNCTISSGSTAIRFVDAQGRNIDLFDFSQVDEGIPPYRWTLNNQNVSKLKENLSFSSEKPFLSELINYSLTPTEITNCMKVLNIPPSEFPAFNKTYANAVQLIVSGRLEIGGNRFSVAPDMTAFKKLASESARLTFLTYASQSARSALLTIENEITRINNEERNVNYDLRDLEKSNRIRTGESSGRGTSDNTDRTAHEQSDGIEIDSSRRNTALEDNAISEQRGSDKASAGIQVETGEQSDILVSTKSNGRDVQFKFGTGRTVNGGRTDRNVRSEVDGIYGKGVSSFGNSDEISSQIPDGSSLSGQSSWGVQGLTGQSIRTGESSSNGFRGNVGLGTSEDVLFGQHSNEGKGSAPDNRSLIDLSDDEKLFQLTSDLRSKEIEFTSLVEKRDFQQISVIANEIAHLQEDISVIKERIAHQPITESDVQALREIRPKRKSVQNMLESEVAQTPKFESLLHSEMNEKSAYEMRKENGNDWRNDNNTFVPIINVPKREISNIRQDKKDGVIERGSFVNKDTNITVIFGAKGIDGSLAHALQEVNRNNPTEPRLAAIYCMRELIENAVCFDSQLSERKNKSPNSLFMHRMYAVFNYDDNFYLANLAIDETYSTDITGNFVTSESLYNAKSIKITPVDDLGFQSHDISQSDSESTGVTIISIAQLYEIVKKYDKNFFENLNSPGRAEREAELFVSAAYNDAVSSYSVVMEQSPISNFEYSATYSDFQLVTTAQQKALTNFADSRNMSIEEAEVQRNELMSIYVHFDFDNDSSKDVSHENKLHNAFAEVYKNNPDMTDKQKTYLLRLEKFAIKHNITKNLVDTAFKKKPAFVYSYGKRSLLSKTVFFGQLGKIESQLDTAIKNQFKEKVDTNINFEEEIASSELDEMTARLEASTEDRIIINKEEGSIYTAYYNPDSSKGGQLIYNTFSFDILAQALKSDDMFDYISENGNITLCDVSDSGFMDSAKEFFETKWDYIGNINDFRDELSELTLNEDEQPFLKDTIEPFEDFRLDWEIIHEADDENGNPTEWSAKISEGKFVWIDKTDNGYSVYNTPDTSLEPIESFSLLPDAMDWVENDYLETQKTEITASHIKKYNLDIDFNKIKDITLQTEWVDYIGGIDSDGHERKDNAELRTDTVTIGYNSDTDTLTRYDSEGLFPYDEPITLTEALTEIQEHLDKSLKDNNYTVYITKNDDTKEYLFASELLAKDDVPDELGNTDNEPTQLAFDFESDNAEKVDTNINFSENTDNADTKKRHKATIQEKLYKQFSEMYPEIVNGNHTYERYGKQYAENGDNDAFEPLSIEYLGDNTYGFMTYYVQNGDLMRDPDFTFKIDNESKTLTVLEYQLDGAIGIGTLYERVHDENGIADKKLLSALSENLMQCLKVAKDIDRPLTKYTDKDGNNITLGDENSNSDEVMNINIKDYSEPDTLAEIVYADNPSGKIRDNIAAIRELKRIEEAVENNREPYFGKRSNYFSKESSDERLRKYCGWGGLAQVFDERTSQYGVYRNVLKEILTPEEYKAASASTLNAHYTSQNIIDSMYKAIRNMDLPRNARILEPACGTGNFISRLPSSLGETQVVGVELDSLTARIAKCLNSENDNIHIIESGFEKTNFDNDSFDLAIGNVPFGDYNLNDPDYVNDWRIHDAFFRKALDKVAPGGVVAFITSTGTMDKKNPKIREYLATKAELVGAIRLPNNAFATAGTKASSDIIFLKKRENPLQPFEPKPDWCYTEPNDDGLKINSYFVKNPQMVLGKIEKTTHFDMLTCVPFENAELDIQLDAAIKNLNAKISVTKRNATISRIQGNIEPWGKNFTYQIKDNNIYYRQSENMIEQKFSAKEKEKVKALCEIRDAARQLIDMQQSTATDETLIPVRKKLNELYDNYKENNGFLANKTVKKLFGLDSDFPLLLSLEKFDKESNSLKKSDIFYQRTVNPTTEINSVETVEEALQISLDRKGKPNIPYMAVLLEEKYPDYTIDKVADTICNEMLDKGYIFIDPEQNLPDIAYSGIVERSEYLSGNVRMKLTLAEEYAKTSPVYEKNVNALRKVLPDDIRAEEIVVQMGCPWIDAEDYTKFLQHLSGRTGYYNNRECDVTYSAVTGEFSVLNAGSQKNLNVNESTTYGTSVYNLYQLAEKILNQRRIVVMTEKPHPTDPDKTVTRTDAKQTKIALDKAKLIREEFNKWIFTDTERKAKYERKYNDIFNSLVGREYDGSKLTFPGLTTLNNFTLRPHQKNCVARAIYGGNTLAAHVVGAGKSAVMFTTVMKKKELGLINKACVVVPKTLTEQTANEWRKLYPNSKILTVTNDDLSNEAKRNVFTARVATGSYDAVILSQEQYEKIPMSKEYRIEYMQKELDALEDMLRERNSESRGKKDFSIKTIEKSKKQLEARIEKLTNPKAASRAKDDLLEFEQLGFDYLVVDEAHAYKNGFVTTKMTNVAGVTTRPSGRAEDMQMKTDYFNEKLGQGHILFCTGTPVSNSMTELYVMTRYLRPDLLKQTGVERFDDWAATFGSVVTKNQQAADGTLKLRTSFAKFANLPELMAMYKEFADVQSADKLNLPRPNLKTGKPQIIKVPATPEQKAYVKELAERAEQIANGLVDPSEDNLLKITGEARLIGLGNNAIRSLYDKRNEGVPYDFQDSKDSKVDKCIENVARIYENTNEKKGVQIIFSDIAVNSDKGNFSVYNYIKNELIEKYDVPENEIIFAPKSDSKERENIFKDINNAKYRVVIASTGTLGTGANIQNNLYALHHIDVPWKPSDFEQREGRILRQGNNFKEVEIFNYVTEGTLDSYLYQTVTDKARFIAQLLDDKCPARVSEDCDEKVLTFGEIQAAAEGNPAFKRRIECANEIAELTMLRNDYVHETGNMQKKIETLPSEIERAKERLERIREDKKNSSSLKEFAIKTSDGTILDDKKKINEYLLKMIASKNEKTVISIKGFTVSIAVSPHFDDVKFVVRGSDTYSCAAGETENADNYQRLSNLFVNQIDVQENNTQNKISLLENNLQQAVDRVAVPFPHEQELEEKIQELQQLEEELSGISVQENDIIDAEEEPIVETEKEKNEREKLYENIDKNDIALTENNDDDNINHSTHKR